MLILIVFCIGLIIGLGFNTELKKEMIKTNADYIGITTSMENLIEKQLNTIEVYKTCYEELEKAYNNCHEGISTTINENIELKRRLSNGK